MFEEPSPRRRYRRGVVPAVLTVAVLLAAGSAVWIVRRDAPATAIDAPVAVATATVARRDISSTRSLTGTLGFGAAEPVKGGKDGVVTWLPRPGTTVKRGQQLFRIDDQPVPLFYGAVPLYRDLGEPGTVGRDVRVVAANLKKLGYAVGVQPRVGTTVTSTVPETAPAASTGDGQATQPAARPAPSTRRVTVRKGEGVLTGALIAAIRRWQFDAGLVETGRVGVGDVVVLTGAVRVESVTGQRGDGSAVPLLTVTSTAKVVTVTAAATEAGTIERGDPVSVVLPGDTSVPGRVSAIGTEVRREGDDPDGPPVRTVTVTVDDARDLAGIDAADVQVEFTGETHRDVLTVPVGALVALSEGGYAVQVAGGALVAVTIGLSDKGVVEVAGAGLDEGTPVVTTS